MSPFPLFADSLLLFLVVQKTRSRLDYGPTFYPPGLSGLHFLMKMIHQPSGEVQTVFEKKLFPVAPSVLGGFANPLVQSRISAI